MNDEQKTQIKKRLPVFVLSAVMLFVNIIFFSLGWFTMNRETQTTGANMTSTDFPFELKTAGEIIDPEQKKDIMDNIKKLLENFTGYGEDATTKEIATSKNCRAICWYMAEDTFFDSDSSKVFRPGSSGKMTFEVIPKVEEDFSITCGLVLRAYGDELNLDSDGNPTPNEEYNNYIRSHIRFFKEAPEDGKYKKSKEIKYFLDSDEKGVVFSFDIENEGKPVEENIYWVWVNTLGQFFLPENTKLGDPLIFSDGDFSDDIKTDIFSVLSGNATSFFYNRDENFWNKQNFISMVLTEEDIEQITAEYNEENEEETLDKKILKSAIDKFFNDIKGDATEDEINYFINLKKYYNEADQKTGENIRYITAELEVYPS